MKRLARGLHRHYDIAESSMGYWRVQIEIEDEHGSLGELAVEKLAHTYEEQASIRHAIQHTLDGFWVFFDGVKRCYVDEDPSYERWRDWLRANMSTRT